MRRGTSAGPTVRAAEPIGAVPPSGRGGVRRLTRLGLIGIACAAGLAPPPAAEAAGAPPESLTVAQCVALARAAAPEVRALAAGRQAAGLDSAAAALNRRPAYTLTGGATVAPPFSYDPVITNLGEYRLLVGMQVPLRDAGERRRERAQAGLGAAAASAELERAAREAGERAAEVALGLLRLKTQERSGREALDWLDRLSSLITAGVRAGGQDRAAAVRVALERDAVGSDLIALEADAGALGRELAELTGLGEAVLPRVVEPEAGDDAAPAPADSSALLAWAESAPEVMALRSEEAGERLALESARRKNAVRVDLAMDAGLWGADLTRAVPLELALDHPGATFGDRLWRDLGASLAFEFRRPLWDASAGRAVAAREASLRAATIRTAAAVAARRRAALDLVSRWRTATARLALAQASLGRADDHLLRERSLYAGGAASLLELLDARQQLAEARARLTDARFETRLAHWEGTLRR